MKKADFSRKLSPIKGGDPPSVHPPDMQVRYLHASVKIRSGFLLFLSIFTDSQTARLWCLTVQTSESTAQPKAMSLSIVSCALTPGV
jgi:hypothetical protein